MPREEDLRRFDDSPAFPRSNDLGELLGAENAPVFYLNKGEEAVLRGHEIYLAPARPEIPGHY